MYKLPKTKMQNKYFLNVVAINPVESTVFALYFQIANKPIAEKVLMTK